VTVLIGSYRSNTLNRSTISVQQRHGHTSNRSFALVLQTIVVCIVPDVVTNRANLNRSWGHDTGINISTIIRLFATNSELISPTNSRIILVRSHIRVNCFLSIVFSVRSGEVASLRNLRALSTTRIAFTPLFQSVTVLIGSYRSNTLN